MKKAIDVRNLHKSYGTKEVLKGISFSVEKGEIFALLGINGAGKTTTLEILEGLRKYETGDIAIDGKVGVQLQSVTLPENIRAMEAILLFAKWNHAEVDEEYIERLGVGAFKKQEYKGLSTGQKRRLHLALAMIGNPDIVFLDEPTAGLDVEGRYALHQEIRALRNQGKTIIMASHDMAEVEELCDQIAILKDGEIAFIGTALELTQEMKRKQTILVKFAKDLIPEESEAFTYKEEQKEMETMNESSFKGYMAFETEKMNEALMEIAAMASHQQTEIIDIKVEGQTLEQRFIEIAKEAV